MVIDMKKTRQMVLAALFLALGIILPFFTGQIPQIGSMLLPMHIPVLLCGFICGWQYGLAVGAVTPLLRSMLFGAPPMMPTAVSMTFELAVYGLVTGILYKKFPKETKYIYITLLIAMAAGRVAYGIASIPIYGIAGKGFSFQIYISGVLLHAIPGIILQLILIPIVIMTLQRNGFLREYAEEFPAK